MRRITLQFDRSTRYQPEDAEYLQDSLDYKSTIQNVIRATQGVTFREMELGLKILGILEVLAEGDVLVLEDAEWQYLCEKIENTRWTVTDKKIYDFCRAIVEAPATDLREDESRSGGASESTGRRTPSSASRVNARI